MSTLGSFIWSIADQLRGPYRPNQHGNVILPPTTLRRLSEANGGTKGGLTCETLKRFRLAVPPLDAQRNIAARLDEQTAKIDAMITEADRFHRAVARAAVGADYGGRDRPDRRSGTCVMTGRRRTRNPRIAR